MVDTPAPPEIPPLVDKTLIKPIELDDAQGRWVFEPRVDITGLEAVLISHMFAAMTIRYLKGDQSRFDWREYLTRKRSTLVLQLNFTNPSVTTPPPDLVRHFKSVE